MPIDAEKLLGAELTPFEQSWDQRDIILYALGLGVGNEGVDAKALHWVYEGDLGVIPSFGSLLAMVPLEQFTELPGADINLATALHATQEFRLLAPIPTTGTAVTSGRVTGVHDKGKLALVVLDTEVSVNGKVVVTNRTGVIFRGAGGFGGSAGETSSVPVVVPDTAPDASATTSSHLNQAAIYRLSGDSNPLHIDPAVSSSVGLDRPIAHGMCGLGIAIRHVVDTVLDSDPSKLTDAKVRFIGMAYPGDLYRTDIWAAGRSRGIFRTVAANRDDTVILTGEFS